VWVQFIFKKRDKGVRACATGADVYNTYHLVGWSSARPHHILMPFMSQDTYTLILQESCRLFSREGYGGTSMDDIARAVGVTKASLYHHFGSKQDIFLSLLGDILENIQEEYKRDPAGDPRAALEDILERTIRYGLDKGGFLEEVEMISLEKDDEKCRQMERFKREVDTSIEHFLKKCQVESPKISARILSDATQGYMKRKMMKQEQTSPKTFSRILAKHILTNN
jgi:AcrR family transcriptional regulator